MKKIALLLLSLALIVGCLFAFSSCECEHEFDESKAETITDATCETDGESKNVCLICHETVSIAIPQLGHKWSTKRTVDAVATCVEDGSESTHCTRKSCTAKKDVTVLPMDPTAHGVENWTITAQATIFANGSKNGYCPHCKQNIVETISNEDAILLVTSKSTDPVEPNMDYTNILEEGQHFYPTDDDPDGNDLFVEFSILWNQHAKNGSDVIGFRLWGHKGDNNLTFMQLNLKDNLSGQDGTFAGSFEPSGWSGEYAADSPNKGYGVGQCTINDPDITKRLPGLDKYGWHRVGIRFHQDAEIVDGEVMYTGLFTLYLDGEVVLKWYATMQSEEESYNLSKKGGLLYIASIDPNDPTKLVYEDNIKGFGPYIYIENFANSTDFYLPLGDISFTAGDDFAYSVEKLSTAANATSTYVVDADKNLRVSAKRWYKYK